MSFWIAFTLGIVAGGFLAMLRLRSKIRFYKQFIASRLVPETDQPSKERTSANSKQMSLIF